MYSRSSVLCWSSAAVGVVIVVRLEADLVSVAPCWLESGEEESIVVSESFSVVASAWFVEPSLNVSLHILWVGLIVAHNTDGVVVVEVSNVVIVEVSVEVHGVDEILGAIMSNPESFISDSLEWESADPFINADVLVWVMSGSAITLAISW